MEFSYYFVFIRAVEINFSSGVSIWIPIGGGFPFSTLSHAVNQLQGQFLTHGIRDCPKPLPTLPSSKEAIGAWQRGEGVSIVSASLGKWDRPTPSSVEQESRFMLG